MNKYVDAHFHFDLYKNPAQILSEIDRLQIQTIAVTNAPSVFHHTKTVARSTTHLIPAVGLHPELVASHGSELDLMWPYLDDTRFVGEVGLDYVSGDQVNRAAQRNVFSKIIERCSGYGDKILSIHSRRSATDVISIVGDKFPGRVILHWFSGSRRELERAITIGCFFSVGPAMVHSKNGTLLLSAIPKDRILTETDGPFVQVAGRPAKPSDVLGVIEALAKHWDVSTDEVRASVSHNFTKLLADSTPSESA